VEDGREGALPAFGLEDPGHVVVGIAGVDHQRQLGFPGRGDMAEERGALCLAGRTVVVVVEPGLADRHDLRMRRQRDQFLGRHIGLFMRAVRMRADGAIDGGMRLGDGANRIEAAHPRRDGHHQPDARSVRPLDQPDTILVELREIEMAMAVDEHGFLAA